MSLEENKRLIQHLFEEVINNNRTELLEGIFVPGSMIAGENTGPFMGQAPTGQSILFTRIHYYRIRNRRIYTAPYEHDLLGLMEQLGMLPPGNRPDI